MFTGINTKLHRIFITKGLHTFWGASAINAIIQTEDANIPDTLDAFIAVGSYLALIAPGCELLCATADFAHAYKHVPILEDRREFATIILAPPQGALEIATLRTQPFGSKRDPTNRHRATLLLNWVMLSLLGLVIGIYVDDVFIIETAGAIHSAYHSFKAVCAILGFQLGTSKQQDPSKTPTLLGAEIAITRKRITARSPERKRKDLANELKQCLPDGHLTPAQAAKLRGRLGFGQSLIFGRLGRALMSAFAQRQYSKTVGRHRPLNDELIQANNWRLEALIHAQPRRALLTPPKPTLAYCDAAGAGHIGFYVINSDIAKAGRAHLPSWFTEIAGIYEFEIAGGLLALHAASCLWPGRPLLFRIGNSAASPTLVRRNCPPPLGATLASALWGA